MNKFIDTSFYQMDEILRERKMLKRDLLYSK